MFSLLDKVNYKNKQYQIYAIMWDFEYGGSYYGVGEVRSLENSITRHPITKNKIMIVKDIRLDNIIHWIYSRDLLRGSLGVTLFTDEIMGNIRLLKYMQKHNLTLIKKNLSCGVEIAYKFDSLLGTYSLYIENILIIKSNKYKDLLSYLIDFEGEEDESIDN